MILGSKDSRITARLARVIARLSLTAWEGHSLAVADRVGMLARVIARLSLTVLECWPGS